MKCTRCEKEVYFAYHYDSSFVNHARLIWHVECSCGETTTPYYNKQRAIEEFISGNTYNKNATSIVLI
jgi:hypothetical protein